MPLPSNDIRAQLAKLRSEFAERAALNSEYEREMASKYIHQMIPFEDWLAMRNAQQGKAEGGLTRFLKPSKIKERVYHGTGADFNKFEPSYQGAMGPGVYVTKKPKVASEYALASNLNPNVMPLHVHVKNPFEISSVNKSSSEFFGHFDPSGKLSDEEVIELAKLAGYDAVHALKEGEINVFDPRAIKSAHGNRGTYDRRSSDITKASGGLAHMADGGQEDDYRSSHTAPGPHFGAPMHDVTRDMYPKDFYGPNGFRYYADFGEHHDRDAYNKVIRVKGKPDEMVYIHRAIPTSVYKEALKKEAPYKHMIRPGDWVAISKQYAKDHGESVLNGDYKVVSRRVPAKHVWTNGDSVHEWGYHPVETKASGGSIPSQDVMRLAIGGQGPKNWLKGRVEQVIEPLKQQYPDMIAPGIGETEEVVRARHPHIGAINNWIDRNLANYIRKQMATHDDPIRKLAEQGIVHMPPEQMGYGSSQANMVRKKLGAPQLGQSPEAQAWEDATDVSMTPHKISNLHKSFHEPWMQKVDPETEVFYPTDNMHAHYLGFDHLVDILKEDLNQGRIRPEQLSKVSIEQAVRRAHEYDQERKKAMAETALKATEGMPVHKDYGNGFKWIELTMPEIDQNAPMPEKYEARMPHPNSWALFDKETGKYVTTGLESPEHARIHAQNIKGEKKLQDALKYEGDTMGHCVGGYCPDVVAGHSRIFSLRDAKNEPHVTVEVKPPRKYDEDDVIQQFPGGVADAMKSGDVGAQRYIADKLAELNNAPHSIKQIKGKGNAKPKKDYIPYVQDFVKSGKWSEVNELLNADLYHVHPESDVAKNLSAAGEQVPTYVTNDELTAISKRFKKAHGGEVDAEEVFMKPKKVTHAHHLEIEVRKPWN